MGLTQRERAAERKRILSTFDPNGIGKPGRLFGLPFTPQDAELVIIPVPWNVTVSYLDRENTCFGPQAVLSASPQIDYYLPDFPHIWRDGIALAPIAPWVVEKNAQLRKKARRCIQYLEKGGRPDDAKVRKTWQEINQGCAELVAWVKGEASSFLKNGQIVGVLGGDHSVALGLMQALAERHSSKRARGLSVCHIDAHFDLRRAFEGFTFSHASIMFNAGQLPGIERFVHIGVRDSCEEEWDYLKISRNHHRGNLDYTYADIHNRISRGESWDQISADAVSRISSRHVYVSLDIDGLDPKLCPDTGTPVPGGLEFDDAFSLLNKMGESGKKIIGFDLCEVASRSPKPTTWGSDWNAIVGMRALYRLATLALAYRP